MVKEDSCCRSSVTTHYIMNTFFQNKCAAVYLIQRFFGSAFTHWFLHSFSWLVPSSVGCSCQKGCRTVDRSPPGSQQLASGKTTRANTNLQDQEILPCRHECKKIFVNKQHITLVLRAPRMHSGCRVGLTTVQSSCSFICCSGMQTNNWVWWIIVKK